MNGNTQARTNAAGMATLTRDGQNIRYIFGKRPSFWNREARRWFDARIAGYLHTIPEEEQVYIDTNRGWRRIR